MSEPTTFHVGQKAKIVPEYPSGMDPYVPNAVVRVVDAGNQDCLRVQIEGGGFGGWWIDGKCLTPFEPVAPGAPFPEVESDPHGCMAFTPGKPPFADVTYHDTGERSKFETGAVRDANVGKGLPHMIPPVALRLMALRFEEGAAKYARNNWMKGIPLSRYQDAVYRHMLAWSEGQTDENHMGALIWNVCCMAWTEEQIAKGKLPPSLHDLPYRALVLDEIPF